MRVAAVVVHFPDLERSVWTRSRQSYADPAGIARKTRRKDKTLGVPDLPEIRAVVVADKQGTQLGINNPTAVRRPARLERPLISQPARRASEHRHRPQRSAAGLVAQISFQ